MTVNPSRFLALFRRSASFLSLLACLASSQAGASAETAASSDAAPVYFIGHLNPDTDSIMSALAAADFFGGIAARTGVINKESAYLLKRFGLPEPVLVNETNDKKFFLLDFNQTTQAPLGINSKQIVGLIDHHALQGATFEFPYPIDITIKAWGSTCTILSHLYQEAQRPIRPAIAQALLAGILSDTLALTSPTTTAADLEAVALLAPLAGVSDTQELAHAMFEAKSDIASLSSEEVVNSDFKLFRLGGQKVGFGVVESLDWTSVRQREAELKQVLARLKKDQNLSYLFFAVINPETKESYLLLPSAAEEKLAEISFGQTPANQQITTTPMVSRKREFIPKLSLGLQRL